MLYLFSQKLGNYDVAVLNVCLTNIKINLDSYLQVLAKLKYL